MVFAALGQSPCCDRRSWLRISPTVPYNAIVTPDPSIGRRTERRLRGVVTLDVSARVSDYVRIVVNGMPIRARSIERPAGRARRLISAALAYYATATPRS